MDIWKSKMATVGKIAKEIPSQFCVKNAQVIYLGLISLSFEFQHNFSSKSWDMDIWKSKIATIGDPVKANPLSLARWEYLWHDSLLDTPPPKSVNWW